MWRARVIVLLRNQLTNYPIRAHINIYINPTTKHEPEGTTNVHHPGGEDGVHIIVGKLNFVLRVDSHSSQGSKRQVGVEPTETHGDWLRTRKR